MAALNSSMTAVTNPSGEATSVPEGADLSGGALVTASSPLDALDPGIAALCTPLVAGHPCGPDLELAGDLGYLNFFAQSELVLPGSFFNALDGTPFDRTSVDIGGQLEAIKQLLARTRDIRLLIMQARLQILNRDLAGFAVSVAAAAYWLDAFWDQVHPQPEGGEVMARSIAISALNISTVIFPLQYTPLFDASRLGTITYRAFLVATDEVKPRTGEEKLATSAIIEARGDVNSAALIPVRKHIAVLKSALDRIHNAFAVRGVSVGLDNIVALVGKIQAFIDPAEAAEAPPIEAQGSENNPSATGGQSVPRSLAEAGEALAAIAAYYSLREPSSPTLPLVRQAHQLIGKSFIEVIRILVPNHMEKAAFQIGSEKVFELPISKLSDLSGNAPELVNGAGQETARDTAALTGTVALPRFQVESRAQAIALLDQIQRYFRSCEPSSPVPMLCARARAFAESDFMAVLRDVLPKAALRDIGADK
jgi:type VI secretion system protein ImpA